MGGKGAGGTVPGTPTEGVRIIPASPAAGSPAGGGSCRMLPHRQACGALQPQPIVM